MTDDGKTGEGRRDERGARYRVEGWDGHVWTTEVIGAYGTDCASLRAARSTIAGLRRLGAEWATGAYRVVRLADGATVATVGRRGVA